MEQDRFSPSKRNEAGFGLMEVVVAMGVIFVALTVLLRSATVALNDIGHARQRQGANGIASEILEKARALPYDTLTKGLATADLAGDPRIVSCGVEYRFLSCSGEVIVHTAGLPNTEPLVPHVTSMAPPGSPTSFERAVYVTRAAGAPPAGAFRITVLVDWDGQFRSASSLVEVQTLAYSPEGCVDTATHPVTAPCRAFFAGTATASRPTYGFTGTVGSSSVNGALRSVANRTDMQSEQTKRVHAAVDAIAVTLGSGAVGGARSTADADDDPGTPVVAYGASSLGGTGGTLTAPSGGFTLRLSTTSAGTGTAAAATEAGAAFAPGSQVCPLPPAPPAPNQNDLQVCGHAETNQAGNLDAALDVNVTVPALGSVNLGTAALVAAPGTGVTAWSLVDRVGAPSGDGRLEVSASRTIGDLRIGGLPLGVVPPVGWQGHLVRIVGYSDLAAIAVGETTNTPMASAAGTLQYWNGSSYTSIPLSGCTETDVPFAPVDIDQVVLGAGVSVDIGGALRTGACTKADPDGPGNGIERGQAEARVSSPMAGALTYDVVVRNPLGAVVSETHLNIAVDLGTQIVKADYREASGA